LYVFLLWQDKRKNMPFFPNMGDREYGVMARKRFRGKKGKSLEF